MEGPGAPKPGYVWVAGTFPAVAPTKRQILGATALSSTDELAGNLDSRARSSVLSVDLEKSGAAHTTGHAHSDNRSLSAAPPALQ